MFWKSWSGLRTKHFNKTLKLKQNEVILTKPQSTLNHITFQPIWLSKACLTIVASQSLPPPLSILSLKPYTSLPDISQLDEGIPSFPIQCFEQKRNYICYANTSNLSGNFNTFLCKNCTLWIPLNVQYWHNSISGVLQTSLYFCF